ncbi:hypothetical protein BDY21DRAFT_304402 [Lineolata rhizophorae]|uniref:TPR-like protein n=1 Tax=Lineolata rhizophorae TaxID=578093 RepID=A0A6A6NZZ2_9PEZI|nr:hypothetical protein BDY21DRAFT_304402 [Lineolata rhizophorae]
MDATQYEATNGVNGHSSSTRKRFDDIQDSIDIPLRDGDVVEVNLIELLDDPTELCTLLENEDSAKSFWLTIALAYAKQRKVDHAIQILTQALSALRDVGNDERLTILNCMCWMYLWKCREAPRFPSDAHPEARTKEFYIHSATSTLNEASRISPSYPPLFLARGVLYLLRSSMLPPSKASIGGPSSSERMETLGQASKCFDDALRASNGRNAMAHLGKARIQFSLGKYADALGLYQTVLTRAPELIDPDPRIGVGCCFWQLGYKDDARGAWERSLELNPESKIANILLGLYHLHVSSQYSTTDPQFTAEYKKAMTQYTQQAFKLDDKLPLACTTFSSYFLIRKAFAQSERLARRAIELSDANPVISDGYYLLARKEHFEGDPSKAAEYYLKADQARGGDDRGYFPAKFGSAQIKALMQDFDGAKFRLERLVQHSRNVEAMTLLGTLYAEDVFNAQASNSKEDKSTELKKAVSLLEAVRLAWKDSKKNLNADPSVVLNLARLYEVDHPDKSLQCLQQVEKMEVTALSEEAKHEEIKDEAERQKLVRSNLPPQLLNNMGCFYYHADKYDLAQENFEIALNACVRIGDKVDDIDTDALVTTISYNLGRTNEAKGQLDEAKKIYEGLLGRHPDYTDALTRLTYVTLRQNPGDEGPKTIQKLYQTDSSNLEVRSLYGWYLSKSKRRTGNIAEDQEQRHYKHSLQHYDKHDRYSLTGMGNIYLTVAREMRRDTEQEKDKRRKTYERAVEFFDKALQLDPRNSYAAQGIAIALVEDKKDFSGAVQIFTKVRETVKDASVYINLGHVYYELKQYLRSIENYEAALAKDRARDTQILACLGRAWLAKGKQEKNVEGYMKSLEYSRRALEIAPDQIHFQFNVAFVQIQMAQLVYTLPENQRSLSDVEVAAKGLDEAIEAFSAIVKAPNPPFPRGDIEQRANMGRNTMRKQLERAMQNQREYEEKNAARLKAAREQREAEIRKREEEKRRREEQAEEQKRKIAEERQRMQERDRELAEQRAEEERRREEAEYTDDPETGERRKRTKRKGGGAGGGKRKKKAADESESEGESEAGSSKRRSRQKSAASSNTAVSSGDDRPRRKKKRKLERKSGGARQNKYKSAEMVVDSSEEDEAVQNMDNNEGLAEKINSPVGDQDDDEEAEAAPKPRRKTARVISDEDEDEDDVVGGKLDLKNVMGDDEDTNMADTPGDELPDDSDEE